MKELIKGIYPLKGLVRRTRPLVWLAASRTFENKAATESVAPGCPHQSASEKVDWNNARPFKDIPRASKFEIIRSFLPGGEFYKKSVFDLLQGLNKKYGDIYIMPGMFGENATLCTFHPDIYQKVFRNEGQWPTRRSFNSAHYYRAVYKKDFFKGVEGLIMTSGESWGHFRTAVNPVLMQPKNAKEYLMKMLPVNSEFLQRIRKVRDPETLEMPGTFLDDINRLTFESVATIALGQELGIIRRNRESPEAELLFKSVGRFFDLAYELDAKPSLWRYYATPKFKKMMAVNDDILNITKKFIDQSLERIEKDPKTDNELKSLVEKLAKKDKLIAVVMAMDLLLAGIHTTSTSLVGILFGLAKNPDKQEKLREEICKILPQKDSLPTFENMKNLPYLRACIKEGIRMYPAGLGVVRNMPKDIVLSGYQVPEGTEIVMCNNIILKESKYFPKPDQFIPERWLRTEEADAYKPDEVKSFVYLPFGFGPRSCAGKRIVDPELELTVMRLVRNFYIEFNYSLENAFNTTFLVRPAIPLKYKFAEVES